jgi:hypothetical protein
MKKVVTFSWNKKGISIMIGYILLITSAVVMSAIVYQFLKSYVPKDTIDCPDGVSLYVVDSNCTLKSGNTYELRLQIRNNGRFDVGGYFIHATDSPDQELAAIDLSPNLLYGGKVSNNAVVFITQTTQEVSNFLNPNDEITGVFNTTKKLYSIELIPIRYQVEDNKKQLVSCGKAKIIENLKCGEQNSQEEEGCTDTCSSLGYNCGTATVCGQSVNCGTCNTGYTCESNVCTMTGCLENSDCTGAGEICNANHECTLCGNGVVDSGESCDSVTGCSSTCTALPGYGCVSQLNLCS